MSPASNSKSKDKKGARANASASVGFPATGYNPILGTFHTFEAVPVSSSSPLHTNGRFRNIDDTDDHNGNSLGAGIEVDSISNNGSWSGESEDHKEKISQPSRQEPVPGAENDKREKTRLKNERKHQRQRERRAQELHERCSGYLMSRKLEALAQQLVAMGFSQERATMALILNEGRLEESVSWLFEGGEDSNRTEHTVDTGGNLKIDISEELEKITGLEIRYKVSKQEVERAIVACEGDIEKAEEALKSSKQENISTPAVAEAKVTADIGQISTSRQLNPSASMQQKRDDKEFNYTKVEVMMAPSVDNGSKGTPEVRKAPYKVDWTKPQPNTVSMDKRWSNVTLNPPAPNSLPSPLQAFPPPSKIESHYLPVRDDLKNLQLGSMREPVHVMQRHQSINGKLAPSSTVGSSPPGAAMGWHPSGINIAKPNGLVSPIAVSTSLGNGVNPHSLYSKPHFQPQKNLSNTSSIDPQESCRPSNSSWSRGSASSTLSAASSLGLFTGLGTSCSSGSSPVDWNTGSSMLQFDYTNIDWSLDTRSLVSRSWAGMSYSSPNNGRPDESFQFGAGLKPSIITSGNSTVVTVLPEGGVASSLETIPNGSRDQRASTFDDKDLFNFSRHFISSPSL